MYTICFLFLPILLWVVLVVQHIQGSCIYSHSIMTNMTCTTSCFPDPWQWLGFLHRQHNDYIIMQWNRAGRLVGWALRSPFRSFWCRRPTVAQVLSSMFLKPILNRPLPLFKSYGLVTGHSNAFEILLLFSCKHVGLAFPTTPFSAWK